MAVQDTINIHGGRGGTHPGFAGRHQKSCGTPIHADHQKRIQGAQDSTYKGGQNSTTTQTINASNIVVILTTIYTY